MQQWCIHYSALHIAVIQYNTEHMTWSVIYNWLQYIIYDTGSYSYIDNNFFGYFYSYIDNKHWLALAHVSYIYMHDTNKFGFQ